MAKYKEGASNDPDNVSQEDEVRHYVGVAHSEMLHGSRLMVSVHPRVDRPGEIRLEVRGSNKDDDLLTKLNDTCRGMAELYEADDKGASAYKLLCPRVGQPCAARDEYGGFVRAQVC